MQNHPDIEWVINGIVQDWLLGVISLGLGALFPALFYFMLYVFGKENAMKPERRKHFYVVVGFFAFILVFAALVEANHLNNQLEDIRTGNRDGVLHAGVLAAIPLGPPIMTTNIDAVGTISGGGYSSSALESGIDMLFIIRVDNSGPPTTAWNWHSHVILPGGGEMVGYIPSIATLGTKAPLPTAYGNYSLKMEDNLLDVLSFEPLQSGAGKEGWLEVHVNGLSAPQSGMQFIITFEDVFGREIKIDHTWVPGT